MKGATRPPPPYYTSLLLPSIFIIAVGLSYSYNSNVGGRTRLIVITDFVVEVLVDLSWFFVLIAVRVSLIIFD